MSFAISIWINAVFYNGLTPAGELATRYVAWALLIIGFVFAALGGYALFKRARV